MRQNADKKLLRFHLCVVVSMCVYMGVGVCVCMWMCVFKLSQARNVKRWLLQNLDYECVYISFNIFFH